MTWSLEFLRAIRDSRQRPLFVLRSVPMRERIGKGSLLLSSHGSLPGKPLIADRGWAFGGTEITPREWTSTVGAWSVPIVGDVSQIMDRIYPGQVCELLQGYPGWTIDRFQPVALGALHNFTGRPGAMRLMFRDILSALGTRITKTAGQHDLFYDVGTSTTVGGGGYSAGATTLNVVSTTGLQYQDTGAAKLGAVLVTPSIGSPFYLTYTGTTATSLTGVSATGQHGTTAVNASAGDSVAEVAWVYGHPIDVTRRILASTGTAATNGAYDVLPSSWGYGIPDRLLDHEDMGRWIPYSAPASGADDWEFLATEAQANGLAWLRDKLAAGGLFLCVRQGRITCRPATVPHDGSSATLRTGVLHSGVRLSDDDILAVEMWEAWDGSLPVEYARCDITSGSGTLTGTAEALSGTPSQQVYTYDLSDLVYANEANQRAHISARLAPWATRRPERLSLLLGGMDAATLAPGDIVDLSSSHIGGRLERQSAGYDARRCMVTRVDADFYAGRVGLQLAILPTIANEFSVI